MLTLQSCSSNRFLTSSDKYLNFTPNYFILNFFSDDITFVYDNGVTVIGPEHPTHINHNRVWIEQDITMVIHRQ